MLDLLGLGGYPFGDPEEIPRRGLPKRHLACIGSQDAIESFSPDGAPQGMKEQPAFAVDDRRVLELRRE